MQVNLWSYLNGIHSKNGGSDSLAKIDRVFKSQNPKRYIQVKTRVLSGTSHIIAICSDITRIKELEQSSKKIRSMFFSSIAHELRTPLNSIIPMVRLILERYSA